MRVKLKRRKTSKPLHEQIEDSVDVPIDKAQMAPNPGNFKYMRSTGSTLLDLAISGGRVRGGGIPSGILLEVFGPPSIGKTAVLSEIASSIQNKNGDVLFLDPEARLDKEYSRIYGMSLKGDNYRVPDTVSEVFDLIDSWKPKTKGKIHGVFNDSLAALSTELELGEGDTMGMRRAKEFSQGTRKVCRMIKKNNWIIACSNQLREGKHGKVVPGGKAIPFYASLRIELLYIKDPFIIKKKKVRDIEQSEIQGTRILAKVIKNSLDNPYREAYLYIVFRYGIDDIRANLQYLKTNNEGTIYICPNGKKYQRMENAILYVERNNLEEQLRENVIDLWEEIQSAFIVKRKNKMR